MEREGIILSHSGGHYTVLSEGERILCTARGGLRRRDEGPLTGDNVSLIREDGEAAVGVITGVMPRKSVLVRPPVANLDTLLLVSAVREPEINPENLDKLSAVAVHKKIRAVMVFTKAELDPPLAGELTKLYRAAGFAAESVSRDDPEAAREKLLPYMAGHISALAGASGVGKSTLIHLIFPALAPETGSISEKSMRGRHTTRVTTLYPLGDLGVEAGGFLADTPGFSMLDPEKFFQMEKEDLPFAFPEFAPFLGACRFTKCTHRTEDGCRILEEVRAGRIDPGRHRHYKALYDEMDARDPWKKKSK